MSAVDIVPKRQVMVLSAAIEVIIKENTVTITILVSFA